MQGARKAPAKTRPEVKRISLTEIPKESIGRKPKKTRKVSDALSDSERIQTTPHPKNLRSLAQKASTASMDSFEPIDEENKEEEVQRQSLTATEPLGVDPPVDYEELEDDEEVFTRTSTPDYRDLVAQEDATPVQENPPVMVNPVTVPLQQRAFVVDTKKDDNADGMDFERRRFEEISEDEREEREEELRERFRENARKSKEGREKAKEMRTEHFKMKHMLEHLAKEVPKEAFESACKLWRLDPKLTDSILKPSTQANQETKFAPSPYSHVPDSNSSVSDD